MFSSIEVWRYEFSSRELSYTNIYLCILYQTWFVLFETPFFLLVWVLDSDEIIKVSGFQFTLLVNLLFPLVGEIITLIPIIMPTTIITNVNGE